MDLVGVGLGAEVMALATVGAGDGLKDVDYVESTVSEAAGS